MKGLFAASKPETAPETARAAAERDRTPSRQRRTAAPGFPLFLQRELDAHGHAPLPLPYSPAAIPPAVTDLLRSEPGHPLDAETRSHFEQRLDADLSGVRIHTGARASESARSVQAAAYTVGRDIVFGYSRFDTGTEPGRRRLAHELVHSLQQGGSSGLAKPALGISRPSDGAENEADRIADIAVAQGQATPAPRCTISPVPLCVQRQPDAGTPAPAPKAEEPTKEEIKAALDAQNAIDSATAGTIRAKYEAIAKKKLETSKPDFSPLGLDKEHKKVEAQNTPLEDAEVAQAFRRAWQKSMGTPISDDALRLLIAQWRTEGGKKGIYNYNLGNIALPAGKGTAVAPSDPISDYSIRSADEYIPGQGKVKKTQAYAAYDTLDQGAMGMIHHIVSGRPALWAALESGNLRDYVYVLKSYGYFTAPVEDVVVKGKRFPGYLTTSRATIPKPGDPILAPPASPQTAPTADAAPAQGPSTSPSAQAGKPASSCGVACGAFISMQNSANGICRLAGESDQRCVDAKARVEAARKRIAEAGCSCS